ncbi:MAG: aldose 1-epimerase [Ancalomicrobiaceae bacterium]|nr:aldose 1-epimerase [Ancalomicrobiaceae bacterium]
MPEIRIGAGDLEVTVSTRFAAILACDWLVAGRRLPVLRPAGPEAAVTATAAGCFPLVPFGNRLAGNRFAFEDQEFRLAPNTADPCRLHGDGWLADWTVAAVSPRFVDLALSVAASAASPYAYEAHQIVSVEADKIVVALSVTNRGRRLPFGLGLHGYFPLTAATTLLAPAAGYWLEGPGYLPTERAGLPDELDFCRPKTLPERWINNGFEGWSGSAKIRWPERGFGVGIAADALFGRYQLFRPDARFDPTGAGDWFCFEPMSHSPAAFRLPDLGGLVPLDRDQTLAGSIRFEILR